MLPAALQQQCPKAKAKVKALPRFLGVAIHWVDDILTPSDKNDHFEVF